MTIYSTRGIRWTRHSLLRLKERGISTTAVRAALAAPHLRYPSQHAGTPCCHVVTGANGLVVIVDPTYATVITAYWHWPYGATAG